MTPDEELAALRRLYALQNAPGALEDSAKAGASGLVEGAVKVPFALADLAKLGLSMGADKLFGPEWRSKTYEIPFTGVKDPITGKEEKTKLSRQDLLNNYGSAALPDVFYKPQTKAGEWTSSISQGVGGAVGGAGITAAGKKALEETVKAAAPTIVASGALGGAGAKAGQELFPESPVLGSLFGGFLGGVVPSAWMGRTTNRDRALWEMVGGTPSSDFIKAAQNADFLKSQGAKSATVGDVMPGSNMVATAANMLRGQPGGQQIQQKLAGREDDISELLAKALSAAGQNKGSPSAIADTVAAEAAARISQVRGVKNRPYENLKKLPPVPETAVMGAVRNLESAAQQPGKLAPSDQAAMMQIVEALTDVNNPITRLRPGPNNVLKPQEMPGPQTSLPAISLGIAEFGKNPASYGATPGAAINSRAAGIAQRNASGEVSQFPAPWGPAYNNARATADFRNQQYYEPMISGPIGKLAGSPNSVAEVPPSRLEAIVANRSPQEVEWILKQLKKGGNQIGTNSSEGIARALLEQRLHSGAKNAPAALRGEAGSNSAAATEALIAATGGNAGDFSRKLAAMEMLNKRPQMLADPPYTEGMNQAMKRTFLGALFQPAQMLRRISEGGASQETVKKIAAVISEPTTENLQLLQRMSMTDPAVKGALVRAGLLGELIGTTGEIK